LHSEEGLWHDAVIPQTPPTGFGCVAWLFWSFLFGAAEVIIAKGWFPLLFQGIFSFHSFFDNPHLTSFLRVGFPDD